MNVPQEPRLKIRMKEAILQIMYQPYEDRRKRALQHIIDRNCVLQHTSLEMFTFKGATYGIPPIGTHARPKLHPELYGPMLTLLDEGMEVYMNERPYVDNYIAQVLTTSPSANDWLRLFPETFQGPVKQLLSFISEPPILTNKQVSYFLAKNEKAIRLMKERMAINLLHA